MKKSLTNLIENANTLLLNLDHINALKQSNQHNVNALLKDISAQVQLIRQELNLQRIHKKNSIDSLDQTLQNMESSLAGLGLTCNQQQTLRCILCTGIDKSLKHIKQADNMDEQLECILKNIETLLAAYQ